MSRARRIDGRQPDVTFGDRDIERTPMQPDDETAEWLVRWEEALLANQPPPSLDELPAELRPRARMGLRLLRGFARLSHGLTTTAAVPPGDAPQAPPDTP